MMGDYIPLKNYFNADLAIQLSQLIERHQPTFSSKLFIAKVTKQVMDKELKARVEVIAKELRNFLPTDYEEALAILLNILGPENETEEGMFTKGYFLMPVAYFVEKYGLDHFDTSMHALVEITKRHTSEYALRPYLSLDIDRCLEYFLDWIEDPNPHVRRLVSEGTRPRLPWAKKIEPIKNDPLLNLQLLEKLMADPSSYVLKSVANHLNDLTKHSPRIVVTWMKEYMQRSEQINKRVVKHGLRTLLKLEVPEAVQLVQNIEAR